MKKHARFKHGDAPYGKKKIKEYLAWANMKKRCFDKKHNSYKNYGARGIGVCTQWLNDYAQFLKDMGRCPEGFSLDRIDVNQGYSPENCKWSSKIDQCNNTRANVFITYNGKTQTLTQWSRELNLNSKRTESRFRVGLNPEKIFLKDKLILKLSPFDTELVVKWYQTKEFNQTAIANAFQISQARVSKILTERGIRTFFK